MNSDNSAYMHKKIKVAFYYQKLYLSNKKNAPFKEHLSIKRNMGLFYSALQNQPLYYNIRGRNSRSCISMTTLIWFTMLKLDILGFKSKDT